MAEPLFRALVVGQESLHNLRLADLLRKQLGKDHVSRFLEIRHLLDDLASDDTNAIGIFFDVFSFSPKETTEAIGYIRQQYPKAVFALYLSEDEYVNHWRTLPSEWQERLGHYFKLFKESGDIELEPIVRNVVHGVQYEAERNATGNIVKLTKQKDGSTFAPHSLKSKAAKSTNTVFISYARSSWSPFVSNLVNRLRDKNFDVWVDQHLIQGGDDWMDGIGAALETCKVLVLVMSPEALQSRYVKMEYRYFFLHGKPIIPLLYQPVDHIPPELSTTQYMDFSAEDKSERFSQLYKVLQTTLDK